MTATPQIPANAPFSADQRAWLNGYLAGLFSGSNSPATPAASTSRGSLLFLYGSQSGSSEGLARKFGKLAKKQGFETKVSGLQAFASMDISKESRIAIITSTYGDGEMPDNAQQFWDYIKNGSAPKLDHLEFSVLSLGDRNYTFFCEAGRLIDERLAALGAKRIQDRCDCDVDYDQPAAAWFDSLLGNFGGASAEAEECAAESEESGYTKNNPYPATLKTNFVLNGEGSSKETRHFEILLDAPGLDYEVGDALGVLPTNCSDFVSEILAAAGLDGEEPVKDAQGVEHSLRLLLTRCLDLKPLIEKLPPHGISAEELCKPLRNLQPRLYSISSSLKAHPGEVHLTVGIVRYKLEGLARKGACSTFLADRVSGDHTVPVFIHKSPSFRLPADSTKPVIMVGPGTGIAPFRAFLHERRATGATGKNWLFFGDQRADCDFLYREELLEMQKDGHLTEFHTAFSRDQAEKLYVQHRMIENANELWNWFQEGASFYVCGDAKRMAKDVDAALHQVAEIAGGLDAGQAVAFVNQLKIEKRYLRDVY